MRQDIDHAHPPGPPLLGALPDPGRRPDAPRQGRLRRTQHARRPVAALAARPGRRRDRDPPRADELRGAGHRDLGFGARADRRRRTRIRFMGRVRRVRRPERRSAADRPHRDVRRTGDSHARPPVRVGRPGDRGRTWLARAGRLRRGGSRHRRVVDAPVAAGPRGIRRPAGLDRHGRAGPPERARGARQRGALRWRGIQISS